MYEKLIVIGNVGRNGAEMRFTPSGKAVTGFSVAVNKQFTRESGEKVKQTRWFHVSTFGKLAENCNQYVKQGMRVLVEGELQSDEKTGGPRIWTRADGSPGANFEITAQNVRFLSPVGDGQQERAAGAEDDFGGDIPF